MNVGGWSNPSIGTIFYLYIHLHLELLKSIDHGGFQSGITPWYPTDPLISHRPWWFSIRDYSLTSHRPWGFSIRDYSLTSQRPWRFSILHGYTVAYEEEEWIKYYRWMKRWMNYKKQKMLALYCWKRNVGLSATNWFNRNFLQKKWYFFLFNNFEQNTKNP